MRKITGVDIVQDRKLRLHYGSEALELDFAPVIAQGGIFSELDKPEIFSQVSIGEHGRYLRWPGELDFCADALWLEAHAPISG